MSLPIQQLAEHVAKSIYFNPMTKPEIIPDGSQFTETELKDWLTSPRVIYGVDNNRLTFEEWIFPTGQTILFTNTSKVNIGIFTQTGSTLCTEYTHYYSKSCGKIAKNDTGYFFDEQSSHLLGGYMSYFHSIKLDSDIRFDSFLTELRSVNADILLTKNKQNKKKGPIEVSTSSSTPKSSTPNNFKPTTKSQNDVAIIIGNKLYAPEKSSIPNVNPAILDANAIYEYLANYKGLSPDNIIRINNATQSQMVNAFGTYRNHKGSAYNWVKAGKSNLYVYYAGHGAPSEDGGLLIPTDAKYDSVELNGYPVSQLLNNLSKIPAKSITVMLESCFSGVSAGGTVVANASPIYIQKPFSSVPENINLITAAGPNQIASWQKDKRQSLFTKYLLAGLKGQADSAEYGNGDGKVDQQELQRFLDDTMTYEARRGYGREQSAKVQFTNGFVF